MSISAVLFLVVCAVILRKTLKPGKEALQNSIISVCNGLSDVTVAGEKTILAESVSAVKESAEELNSLGFTSFQDAREWLHNN